MGPSILPLLPKDESIASAAARDTIRHIRRDLKRQSALATLKASLVTLRGRLPLRVALEIITKQTGNEFDLSEIDQAVQRKHVSVDFAARPFWNVCDDLIHATGLAYAGASPRGRLKLVPLATGSSDREVGVANEGPIRVSVISATLRTPPEERSQKQLRIGWRLMAEPRLRPCSRGSQRTTWSSEDQTRPFTNHSARRRNSNCLLTKRPAPWLSIPISSSRR